MSCHRRVREVLSLQKALLEWEARDVAEKQRRHHRISGDQSGRDTNPCSIRSNLDEARQRLAAGVRP
jgi:hypothetical protein